MKYLIYNKINLLWFILFLAIFTIAFFAHGAKVFAETSADAIAIRVIPNPEHVSPARWYKNQKFTGAPQSMLIDGYEAVRDGRTVYVNAANVVDSDNNGSMDKLYTNIYLISYNQSAESATMDIFGQILARWKFNSNFSETQNIGKCYTPPSLPTDSSMLCRIDSDCEQGDFCNSLKAKIVRDMKRISDLYEIRLGLENYKLINGTYPKLTAGTYLSAKTISAWPSWQNNFSKELSIGTLPVDPINVLGSCAESGFDQKTCWNEKLKKFGNSAATVFSLPSNSFVYLYLAEDNGREYKLNAVMESGLAPCYDQSDPIHSFCADNSYVQELSPTAVNNPPTINCGNLQGYINSPFSGYISANDPDGDAISWVAPNFSVLSEIGNTNEAVKLKALTTPQRNQIQLKSVDASGASISFAKDGLYTFEVKITDSKGLSAVASCNIKINKRTYCGDGIKQAKNDFNQIEYCDDGARNTDTVCAPTYGKSCSYCDKNCVLQTVQPIQGCGNNKIEGQEECDGTVILAGWNCASASDIKPMMCSSLCKRECLTGYQLYQGRCGDGSCVTPENNINCSTDCQAQVQQDSCSFPATFGCVLSGASSSIQIATSSVNCSITNGVANVVNGLCEKICPSGFHKNFDETKCVSEVEETCDTSTVIENGIKKRVWYGDELGWGTCQITCNSGYTNIDGNVCELGEIGDFSGGGIIYYYDDVNRTVDIVARSDGEEGKISYTPGAVKYCNDARYGDFSDWRVPNLQEAELLYGIKDLIGGFANDYYWTTNEPPMAFTERQIALNFDTGIPLPLFETSAFARIRCVRRITY